MTRILSVVAVLALVASSAQAAEDLVLDLTLRDAVQRRDAGTSAPRPAIISVRRVGDRWQPAAVLARGLNANYGIGHVEDVRIGADRARLRVVAEIADDPWVEGGWGDWTIELERAADGTWSGTHAGTFAERPVRGPVLASFWRQPDPVRAPAAPGEHPRLLLRAADVPALRARLASAFGQAAAARLVNAPGLALRHAITGDPALAEAAMAATRALIEDRSNGSKHVAHRAWAWRLQAVAIAYDCCYASWPPSFRDEVRTWINRVNRRILYQHQNWTEYTNFSLGQRFGTVFIGAAAIGTLAVAGDPAGDAASPGQVGGSPDGAPSGPAHADVPRQDLVPGTTPTRWLFAGGLDEESAAGELDAIGGTSASSLAVGAAVGGRTVAQLAQAAIRDGAIDVVKANGRAYNSANWLAAVVVAGPSQAGWYRFDLGPDAGVTSSACWIGGRPVEHRGVVRIEAGEHPVLLRIGVSETNDWGMIAVRPRLVQLDAAQAEAERRQREIVAGLRAIGGAQGAAWRTATGGDPAEWRDAALAEGVMHMTLRHLLGRGGVMNAGDEPLFPLEAMIRAAVPWRNALGRPISPTRDLESLLPRLLAVQVPLGDGGWAAQRLGGRCDLSVKEWFDPERDASSELFACLAPVADPALMPGLRRLWERRTGIADPAMPVQALASRIGGARGGYAWEPVDTHAAYAFVGWPESTPAAEPTAWPLAWQGEDDGWFALRGGWSGSDDAVFQLHAKLRPSLTAERQHAGAVRLRALGHEWWGPSFDISDRFQESVPEPVEASLPDPTACGRLLAVESAPQRLAVSVDLSELWAPLRTGPDGRTLPADTEYGSWRIPEAREPARARATRAVGIDLGGRCGAPVLLVIRDRVEGGGLQRWRHLLHAVTENIGRWEIVDADGRMVKDASEKRRLLQGGLPAGWSFKDQIKAQPYVPPIDAAIAVDGNRFTVTRGDATMSGIIVADRPVALREETSERRERRWHAKGNHFVYRLAARGLIAEGASDYMAVMTVQRGAAPPISVEGEGTAATIRIGPALIRAAGDRVEIAYDR